MGARLDCVAAAAMLAAVLCAAPAWAALQMEKGSAFVAGATATAPAATPVVTPEAASIPSDGASPLALGTVVMLALASACAVAAFARVRWFRWQAGIGPAWRVPPSLAVLAFASIMLAGWWGALAGSAALGVDAPAADDADSAGGTRALVRNVVVGGAAAGAQLAWMALIAWYLGRKGRDPASAEAGLAATPEAGLGATGNETMAATDAASMPATGQVPHDRGAPEIRGRRAPWRDAIALTALANVLGWPILLVVSWLASFVELHLSGPAPRLGHATLQEMSDAGPRSEWWWGAAAMAAVVAPITEEILYRGFLQQGLRRSPMSRGLAIAIASCMFAAFHWGALAEGARLSGMCTLAALSALLGYVYERTGRMSMCIATHALFNAVNLARL